MKLMYIFLALFLFVVTRDSYAQLISRFNWDSPSVTTSEFGPNAISVSGSAVTSPNGVGGTKGLNAGTPKADIDLTLPDSAFMNIGGIDFRIDFQSDESRGDFITCGNNFAFGMMDGELYVKFEVENNSGGTQIVEVHNIDVIPNDDVFRTYRFYYLPNTGYAEILVDGSVIWNHYIGNPADLVWSNDDVVLGFLMDGNGLNKTLFDNVIIGEVYDSALPVEISHFEVEPVGDKVSVNWETESELDNDYFTIERSQDGESFQNIADIKGAGTTSETQSYSFDDQKPLSGISYYRISQTDFNGKSSSTDILSVEMKQKEDILIYPNLLRPDAEFHIKFPFEGKSVEVVFINELGLKVAEKKFEKSNHFKMNAPSSSGIYYVKIYNDGAIYNAQKIVVR